ncbi:MAG: hypothetical protein KAT11_02585 [Phycisphaerae bacterium]|nr:hypothetical protein [Phycisphaerae bacterium]
MRRTTAIAVTVALCLGLFNTYSLGQFPGRRRRRPPRGTPNAAESAPSPETKETEKPAETKPESKPKEPEGVSVAFKDMSIDKVCEFLSKSLKKPVVPSPSIKDKKITIVSKDKMPTEKAVYLVRQALLVHGIVVQEHLDLVYVLPVSEVMQSALPRVPADKSVSTIEDQLQIVTKEFLIQHYDVVKMQAVIKPMLPDFARTVADPDTRKLFVTDTVANLLRIEQVVAGMDIPSAEQTVTKIYQVKHGDAVEITSFVRHLIAGEMSIDVKDIITGEEPKKAAPRPPEPRRGPRGRRPPPTPATPAKAAETGIIKIVPSKTPVTLVPNISRNWIIVAAPAEMMDQIISWLELLDKPREVEKDYEEYEVKFADVADIAEMAQQVEQTLQDMPGIDAHVVPFGQSKRIFVSGSKRGREMAMELLSKVDNADAEKQIDYKTIILKHADAEEMAQRIETLFSQMEVAGRSRSYGSTYEYYRRSTEATKVRVMADKRRNAITVITDPDTMKEIEELIAEEDVAIDPSEAKPKIYELEYADPAEVKEFLTEMFSGSEPRRMTYFDLIFGGGRQQEVKPVGRLLGQFTFHVMPSSNKLIVQSKSVANFQVITDLIAELDQPQLAGLPVPIELKYANAEDLCEQLNAMLAEPRTIAKIRRAARGLSDYHEDSDSSDGSSSSNQGSSNEQSDAGSIEFWWQNYTRPATQMPVSNLIGKIRLVPVYRRNVVMVLAPPGFLEPIRELIEELDQPGRQVVIHARIGEIQHEDQTTLGLRLASDPTLLAPADTALGGSASMVFTDLFFGGTTTITARANVGLLVNLLIREFGMKILLEPSLTTRDNEAAEYFDGQDVPVATESERSAEGGISRTQFDYKEVGTLLRIRPHITKEGSVNLLINLEISRIVPGAPAAGGNPTVDRREVFTEVIVQDGQTVMLSGIIRQDTFEDVRKVPLLGDLPLIGGLFRAIDKGVRNRELVVFITPRVMTTPKEIDTQMEKPLKTLERIERTFKPKADGDSP